MITLDDQDIREFLNPYQVEDPGPALLRRTKVAMHGELRLMAAAPDPARAGQVLFLAGLAVLLCLNLFYVATVGTILSFTLPPTLMVFLRHSLLALVTAGASLLAGSVMVVFFKALQGRQASVPVRS
ncbi:MAG: hypothetical protein U9P14_03640 [Gemmatimonadota bacterium]|nr:hypothetical protein [Gemmatimonadota bacterium]